MTAVLSPVADRSADHASVGMGYETTTHSIGLYYVDKLVVVVDQTISNAL